MYIDTSTICTKTGKIYTRHLLRECYRENGRIKHRTLANLSACSEQEIKAMKIALKYKENLPELRCRKMAVEATQGKSVGAVLLLYHLAKRLGIEKALGNSREGRLALWQIFARVIEQGSRLSSVRLAERHACELLGLNYFNEDDLYENLGWLAERQEKIENSLFKMLNKKSQLFLYDVTSSYLEGECNELAEFGYNRDGKKGKRQIVIGLLCNEEGIPISVEVFAGNTKDNKTLPMQIKKAAMRFGATKVTFVGDRGMIKSAQVKELSECDFHYITAITKPQVKSLIDQGGIQISLFDSEIAEVMFEGVRYILRRNPTRAEELKEIRQSKLNALQKKGDERNEYLNNHPRAKISTAQQIIKQYAQKLKIIKWVDIAVEDGQLIISINRNNLVEESLLDGCYVLKTDLSQDIATKETIHDSYKDLALVEQAFRTCKTIHLEMRPIYVRLAKNTRGHIFVTMLAYRIVKELSKCWWSVDITVEEGITALARLCQIEIKVNNEHFNQITQPDKLTEKLLTLANVKLPRVLPKIKTHVATRVKLPNSRKTT
jgi:transposase